MNKVRNVIIVLVAVAIVVFGVFKIMGLFKKEVSNDQFVINYYKFYSNNKFGVLDKNGQVLIDAIYGDIIIPNPEKDVFFVSQDTSVNNDEDKSLNIEDLGYSVVNKNNQKIFEGFTSVEPLVLIGVNEAYPYEKQVLKYEENGKYGLISYEGKKVTKAIYDELSSIEYKENEFRVTKSDHYGIIDDARKN